MGTSFQKARDYREKRKAAESLEPLPDKPEDMRFGIIFLYASCAVVLVFLIITGDVQWSEASGAGLGGVQAVLVEMAAAACLAGGTGFLLSRCQAWPLYVVCLLAAVDAGFLVAFGGEVFDMSQGLFVSRLLSLLMEVAALWFFTRKPSRAWFGLLRERRVRRAGRDSEA